MEGSSVVRKGAWTKEEDNLLRQCIQRYGEGKWHQVPSKAGLNRCRKSCRLRWLNYLKPDIKRGGFEDDEVDLIVRLHKLLGNRWSLIAGRLPGRTANDVKNYWNSHLRKDYFSSYKIEDDKKKAKNVSISNVIKPQPRTLSKTLKMLNGNTESTNIPAAGNIRTPREDENFRWQTWLNGMEADQQQAMNDGSRPCTSEILIANIMTENLCTDYHAIGNNWSDMISFDDDLLSLFNMEP